MSKLAAAYYQERAERLGIEHVPDVLNGQPFLLLPGDSEQQLSLHEPNPELLAAVTNRYAAVIHDVGAFVVEGFRKTKFSDAPLGFSRDRLRGRNNHINTVIERHLFPRDFHAGHITGIQIEAMARSEILKSHAHRAGRIFGVYYDESSPDEIQKKASEVYLMMSGALHAGRPQGFVACLTVVDADLANPGNGQSNVIAPRYMCHPLSKNEAASTYDIAQLRAAYPARDRWGITNPRIQNYGHTRQ